MFLCLQYRHLMKTTRLTPLFPYTTSSRSVLDLATFWAGPLTTHVLAMLGADVLHVESTARPDGTRLLAGLPFSEDDWWERSGIFAGLNTNKQIGRAHV